ncbi:MAG: helix-turn-helix domain-containing protein [Chloroflexi bacterium]|uniref:Helix-turn-helix domain-containing protein n=1 Tax=Candidatus Chlorohelix allophototropha TaxID=3003348 RepID=A0A8T7M553_9CHLR|nr:helix-turn-helix domain-containing protein [Chloroflexota bacterium]WJW70294.1 helix-turn-helix domain-containing protein [Chloroflexota bacterium L227-S17]
MKTAQNAIASNGEFLNKYSQGLVEKETCGQFIQIPVELLDYDISAPAFKLYVALLRYARQFKACWPSHQRLARDMGLKVRRISDLLKELELAGVIGIESRASEGQTNIYQLYITTEKPDTKRRKNATSSAENSSRNKQDFAEVGMQKSADESHEKKIHEIHDHTHVESTSEKNEEQIEQVCDDSSKVNLQVKDSDNCSHTQRNNIQSMRNNGGESESLLPLLLEQGISKFRAPILAQLARDNGRSRADIVKLIERVQADNRINNHPAYLARMLELDQFTVADANRVTDMSSAKRKGQYPTPNNKNTGSCIDWSKYLPGGKYAYLATGMD